MEFKYELNILLSEPHANFFTIHLYVCIAIQYIRNSKQVMCTYSLTVIHLKLHRWYYVGTWMFAKICWHICKLTHYQWICCPQKIATQILPYRDWEEKQKYTLHQRLTLKSLQWTGRDLRKNIAYKYSFYPPQISTNRYTYYIVLNTVCRLRLRLKSSRYIVMAYYCKMYNDV
jgi:hypothetical protein